MSGNTNVTNGINKQSMHHFELASTQPNELRKIPINQGGQPWCETILVTPELAKFWLGANYLNRKHRKSRVKTYSRDMAAGRWQFNTQGIEFASDGTVINGQHRLMAVVDADVPVRLLVWFNVPPTTRDVIDLVEPRNLSDIARLTNMQAGVTTAMMRGLSSRRALETMSEKAAFYRRFAVEIDGVIARFGAHQRGIKVAPVLGAIARASIYLKSTEIDQFCDVLRSGMQTGDARDATVIKLRDRLLTSKQGFGMMGAKEKHGATLTALRAFGEGRALSKIYPTTADPFPLPDRTGE